MEKRNLQIVAGNIVGLVLDVVSGSINGLVSGAVNIATINGNQGMMYGAFFGEGDTQFNFKPLLIQVDVVSATGIISVPAISIGTNSPSYNNILAATTLTGLTMAGAHSIFLPTAGSMEAMYGEGIYANVTSVAVGTELTLAVDLIGAFQP